MARYVNADKLLEYLEKEAESEDVKYSFIGAGVQATISVIKTFPLEDVKPVIHAHWMPIESSLHVEKSGACSECGEAWTLSDTEYFYYCPNCGAKMDEVQDD